MNSPLSNVPSVQPNTFQQPFYGNLYPQTSQVPMSQVVYSEPQHQEHHQQRVVQQPVASSEDNSAWVPESDIRYKDGIVALALNFCFPGLGHFLLGQKVKGATIFALLLLLGVAMAILSMILIGVLLLAPILYIFVAQLYDGYELAERLKKGYSIMKGEHSSKWVKYSGIGLFVSPSFVTGSESAPQDWHTRNNEIQA